MHNRPRAATIQCTMETHLVTIDKKSFNHAISKGMQKTLTENIDFLKGIPFFQSWTKNSLTKFLLHSVEIHKIGRN